MLALIIMTGVLAGCGKTPDVAVTAEAASPFAIYRREDGQIIKIGDKREEVANILGPDELHVVIFEEDNVESVQYYGNEQVQVNYMADGALNAIRFSTDEWKIFNDLTIGAKTEDVKNKYPAEYIHKYPQTEDLWLAYDENGNLIPFSLEVPYYICFDIGDNGKLERVTIQDNRV